eukprot:1444410-Rhodomonas_salina.1
MARCDIKDIKSTCSTNRRVHKRVGAVLGGAESKAKRLVCSRDAHETSDKAVDSDAKSTTTQCKPARSQQRLSAQCEEEDCSRRGPAGA